MHCRITFVNNRPKEVDGKSASLRPGKGKRPRFLHNFYPGPEFSLQVIKFAKVADTEIPSQLSHSNREPFCESRYGRCSNYQLLNSIYMENVAALIGHHFHFPNFDGSE